MSTKALRTSNNATRHAVFSNLDLVVLAVALPVFVIGDLPLLGYGVACAVWLGQRALQRVFEQRAAASRDPRTVVGNVAGGSIARAWLAALAVLIVGLFDNRAGLSAALLILVLFTIYFATKLARRGGSLQ